MTTKAEYDQYQKVFTTYEWDIETVEDGDIQDHEHRDKLSEFSTDQLVACELFHDNNFTGTVLVLVKDVGSNAEGVTHRAWVYTKRINGKLVFLAPTMDDGKPIPKRYINELEKAQR